MRERTIAEAGRYVEKRGLRLLRQLREEGAEWNETKALHTEKREAIASMTLAELGEASLDTERPVAERAAYALELYATGRRTRRQSRKQLKGIIGA